MVAQMPVPPVPPSPPDPVASPVETASPRDKSRDKPESARSPSEDRARFRELADQGKYAEALAVANAAGFDSQCQHANAEELALIGDTARLAGDGGKAGRAFSILRRRFPGTARAAEAAFALGRLEFDGASSYGKAAEWFKTYLREQPNGRLAREARGRLMEALHRAGDERAARDAAVQYLRDFPSGPHAALAKDIRGSTEP
jgi:TolA-binding protein